MSDTEQNQQQSAVSSKQSSNFIRFDDISLDDSYLAEWLADYGLLPYIMILLLSL